MVARYGSLWCRFLLLALASAPATALTSCSLAASLASDERPVPNEVDRPPVLPMAVVPALVSHIDARGLFRFPTPNVPPGEMSLDTALVQAGEYLFYALNIFVVRGTVEGQRGAFIDLPTLVPCNRPHLARSVYEPPPDSLPVALQLQLGSSWRIPFCGSRRTPEVIVSVATLGNKVRYKNSAPAGDTASHGLAFRLAGVPWEWKAEQMVTAEEAVNEVYGVTGVRAAQLPELVIATLVNGRSAGAVWCPVWRVALERPVRMAAVFTLRRLDLSEVYVADSECPGVIGRTILLTPWTEQPAAREFTLMVPDPTEPSGFRRIVHSARYRTPVTFESVVIEK